MLPRDTAAGDPLLIRATRAASLVTTRGQEEEEEEKKKVRQMSIVKAMAGFSFSWRSSQRAVARLRMPNVVDQKRQGNKYPMKEPGEDLLGVVTEEAKKKPNTQTRTRGATHDKLE